VIAPAGALAQSPETEGPPADATVEFDHGHKGGDVPDHFVGFSIEWTLIERYMGPDARRGFANLMGNLGTGVLRIGGGSQDNMPFDATAPNANNVITPEDVASVRATLDLVNTNEGDKPAWATILGAGTAPQPLRPFATPDNAMRFVEQGVDPAFGDDAGRRSLAGIELGNEPDLNYPNNPTAYLGAFTAYSQPEIVRDFRVLGPNTSEQIAPWQDMKAGTPRLGIRFFHHWPAILDTIAPIMKARPGALQPAANDHYYPLARACTNDPFRCASIGTLLADDRMSNFEYQVYTHAAEAARHDLGYRIEETSTAAGRGFNGVSNTSAAATWTLETLFRAACPDPPDAPGTNEDCAVQAAGLNLHNAEVTRFFFPEEGNAYYNAVNYDPTPAMGSPTAGAPYYGLLLFTELAQGMRDLHRVPVNATGRDPLAVKAWQVRGKGSETRLFLINKGETPVTVDVEAPGARVAIDRMTPFDPTGQGRTLSAPEVRIDGRSVGADGRWPGLDPEIVKHNGDNVPVTIGPGETVVVTNHGDKK
jgi:hypothetical protein